MEDRIKKVIDASYNRYISKAKTSICSFSRGHISPKMKDKASCNLTVAILISLKKEKKYQTKFISMSFEKQNLGKFGYFLVKIWKHLLTKLLNANTEIRRLTSTLARNGWPPMPVRYLGLPWNLTQNKLCNPAMPADTLLRSYQSHFLSRCLKQFCRISTYGRKINLN